LFEIGKAYSKNDIYEILKVPLERRKGAWDTGYRIWEDKIFIFANVGIPGRTGDDYNNYWDGDIFVWEGKKTSHINQPLIKKMLRNDIEIHIFTRTNDKSPFTYEGLASASEYQNTTPVVVNWIFDKPDEIRDERTSYEVSPRRYFPINAASRVYVNKYERNPLARRECIQHYGVNCSVCNINFEKVFGQIGKGFTHVHHLSLISELDEGYVLDPIKDLIPVCPNCHSMLHRKNPPYSIEELKNIIKISSDI
jgi:5-methylcytosine-specific restriction protein A